MHDRYNDSGEIDGHRKYVYFSDGHLLVLGIWIDRTSLHSSARLI